MITLLLDLHLKYYTLSFTVFIYLHCVMGRHVVVGRMKMNNTFIAICTVCGSKRVTVGKSTAAATHIKPTTGHLKKGEEVVYIIMIQLVNDIRLKFHTNLISHRLNRSFIPLWN